MSDDLLQSSDSAGDLSLVPVLEIFAADGWDANHIVRPGARMRCGRCSEEIRASRLEAATIHRIEGPSNPEDMQMVLGIVCPHCSARGALVMAYGPTAPEQDAEFARDVGVDEAREMIESDS